MNSKLFLFSAILILALTSAKSQSLENTVKGNNEFAFDLFKSVFSQDKNVFISPYSISSALAMTYAGARNETEKQMARVLHFDLNQINTHQGFLEINSSIAKYESDTSITLSIANALWRDDNWHFKSDYLNLTKKYYGASIFPLLKPAAMGAKAINDWCKAETKGRIKEVIKEDDLDNARLVLTNAIYFKGDWLHSFNEKETQKSNFYKIDKKQIEVDMMFQKNRVKYYEDEQNQVLELPYKGESISMMVILPKQSSSLLQLSTGINDKLIRSYKSNLQNQEVNIFLPKFKLELGLELGDILTKMGMPDAFDAVKADFAGMSSGLSISKVIHKSFIEVNEKGSEAAAVTAVIMIEKSMSVKKELLFKADRPFIILINDTKTGSILFMGSILNPIK